MSYRIGDKVWVWDGAIRNLWHRGVVVGLQGCSPRFPGDYGVTVEGFASPYRDGGWWCVHPRHLRPRDDGHDRATWSDCAWQPRQVSA